jgi:diguanylate cyclase (GGDEF)-like protein
VRARWFAPPLLAALVLALCLGLTLHQWRSAQRVAAQDLQADFDYRTRELMSNLALRMSSYIQILRGVDGLFASSVEVSRQEFADYVRAQDLAEQFPAVQGIGFMQLVRAGERAAHVAALRREGFADYTVFPDGAREFTAPVVYIEPFTSVNRRAFGWDPYSEPVRRKMLEQARDGASAAMSGKVILLQDGAQRRQAGFLVALPVYRNGRPHATLAQRRDNLVGWVYAPLRVGDLIADLGGERAADLDVEVYDGERVADAARMLTGREGVAHARVLMRTEQHITLAGHPWTLAIGALPDYARRLPSDKPRAVLLAGLAATLLLTVLTWLQARAWLAARAALARARALARDLDSGQQHLRALADASARAQAMLRSILDSTIEGVLVDDGAGRVLASNQRFRELWSVPAHFDMDADDGALVALLLAQLTHPAPFLASRALELHEHEEQRELLRLKDGRFVEQYARTLQLGAGRARQWSFRDVTERKQTEQRERSHRHVLELLARGAPLAAVLDAVVLGVEATNPGMLCTILLMAGEGEGAHLVTGAAPSLPAFYNAAVDGLPVRPGSGACGSAAFTGARVIVERIAGHPYFDGYHEIAARAGLAACWSEPIRSGAGKLLGSFAIYHGAPHYPSPAHVVLIEQAAQLAGIAIEQANAAQALRVGEERFRSLYDHAPVALWEQDWSAVRAACTLFDADGAGELAAYLRARPAEVARLAGLVRVTDANAAALAQVGAEAKDMGRLGMAQLFADSAQASLVEAIAALVGGATRFGCEASFVRLDGSARHNDVALLVMPGHAQTLDFVIASTLDITERHRIDAELRMLATTDFLTGLANRREFMARLDDELARLRRRDGSAAVLMLDIDHFKLVNDNHGHAAGDAVLRHMAGLMRASQRKIDSLGRMGGEEFALLLPGADAAAAALYAERLRAAVEAAPLTIDGATVVVTVSIGIASMVAADVNGDAALIRADKALYAAKQDGRNRVRREQAA